MGKSSCRKEPEKERERGNVWATKVAPIVLSAPFLEDLLRFCRNPIAPSAIKSEPYSVKGWQGGRRARRREFAVTMGGREELLALVGCMEERGWLVKYRGALREREKKVQCRIWLCLLCLCETSWSSSYTSTLTSVLQVLHCVTVKKVWMQFLFSFNIIGRFSSCVLLTRLQILCFWYTYKKTIISGKRNFLINTLLLIHKSNE